MDLGERVYIVAMIDTYLRVMEMALTQSQVEIGQLSHTLDVTSQGKLSPYILGPSDLFQTLQQISLQLPSHLSFVVPLREDIIFSYHKWATVHSAALGEVTKLFIEIPLKDSNQYFHTYRVLPWPSIINGTDMPLI